MLNARHFGVPQNRERIFIIGSRDEANAVEFKYPERDEDTSTFEEVKEEAPVSVKYYLSTKYLETLREHRRRHDSKGNGFG